MPVNDAKAVMRAATRDFLADSDRVDELLEALAEGESLRDLCKRWGLVYPTTMRFLAEHYAEEYEAAKIVRADSALDEMADVERALTRHVQKEGMDFNSARELLRSKQWRAERLNPRRYSPKQTIDMNVTDKTRLHLDALRKLTVVQVQPAAPALTHSPPDTVSHIAAIDAVAVEVTETSSEAVSERVGDKNST